MAYSPHGSSGLSKFLFGEGKTSIRAGAGMYYDLIGQPLAGFIASNSYGLSTSLATPPNVYTSSQLPRFVGFNQIPSAPNAPLFFQPAPTPTFPVSYPNAFAITSSLDDRLKAPYTMNLNFSIGREFSHGWFVQGVVRRTPVAPHSGAARPGNADESAWTRSPAKPTFRR